METPEEKLASPNLGDRLSAVGSLRDVPAERSVALLVKAAQDDNARVRYAAVSLLGQKEDPSVLGLLRTLLTSDPEFDVRAAAAAALGDLHAQEAYEDLAAAFAQDNEWLVKFSILAALGELGDRRAVDLLVTALKGDPLIRTVAAGALGQLGDRRAVGELVAYIDDEDWQLRFRIAQALGELGGEEARSALQVLTHDPSDAVSSTARSALEQLAQ
ncbi:MAG: HEAT repeat domain-containing protein [Aphanocapsa lilacina HA4352-LM1]|jgi:HEAT repeat protein|nr:HEAT repeat domain-containing protein [Aphanocapsa lilacina HA4352-LM1]